MPRTLALALGVAVLGISCASDGSGDAEADDVDPVSAFTAMVDWQAEQQEPVVDDAGEAALPVIYVVAGDGETIEVGVQAAVAEATVDVATVRFADVAGDTFDTDAEDEPVRDHGTMLLVSAMPPPAPTITLEMTRFLTTDDSEPFQLTIAAADPEATGRSAIVTEATPPR